MGEELWFKFDDPSVATGGKNFLQRHTLQDFDDQAYKWISTDISKVERGKSASALSRVVADYIDRCR